MKPFTYSRVNEGMYRVTTEHGEHVGNLKLIQGQWKFKAIGYTAGGLVIPGGGPLTSAHNRSFATLEDVTL